MKHAQPNSPKRKKRILPFLLAAALLVILLPLGVSAYVCASTQDSILSLDDASSIDADAILVLGARVWDSGKPSGILEDRILTGISAYEAGISDRLLMSGDHGQDEYDEVNAMKTYAIKQGVPSEDIFMDHAGFSTYESLYRARDIFQVKTVVIVTQRYHLYRALYVAKRMGLTAYGIPADLGTYSGMGYYEAREILARLKDFFYTLYMPLPTYLGAQIPISGDGNQTNG